MNPAIKRFFGGLKGGRVYLPLGKKSPIIQFDHFNDVLEVMSRLGLEELCQEHMALIRQRPPPPDGLELRLLEQFSRGGTLADGTKLHAVVVIGLFFNPPDDWDGMLIVGVPAPGSESLMEAEIKKFAASIFAKWKTEPRAQGVFKIKRPSTPKN